MTKLFPLMNMIGTIPQKTNKQKTHWSPLPTITSPNKSSNFSWGPHLTTFTEFFAVLCSVWTLEVAHHKSYIGELAICSSPFSVSRIIFKSSSNLGTTKSKTPRESRSDMTATITFSQSKTLHESAVQQCMVRITEELSTCIALHCDQRVGSLIVIMCVVQKCRHLCAHN